MAASDYITVEYLKASLRLKDTNTAFEYLLGVAIASASRQIDQHCRDRFWLDDTPSARLFRATDPYQLFLPAYATTAGMVVELDRDGDGTFETTWAHGIDFQATPFNPEPGWPYRGIEAIGAALPTAYLYGSSSWPNSSAPYGYAGIWPGRARVRVTAQWGWPEVPAQVEQACAILATDHYKSKDVTDGASGPAGASTGRFGSHPSLKSPGFNAMAAKLLCGLREQVIA